MSEVGVWGIVKERRCNVKRQVAKPASQENAYPGGLCRDIRVAVRDITDALLAVRFEVDGRRLLRTILETRPTVDVTTRFDRPEVMLLPVFACLSFLGGCLVFVVRIVLQLILTACADGHNVVARRPAETLARCWRGDMHWLLPLNLPSEAVAGIVEVTRVIIR